MLLFLTFVICRHRRRAPGACTPAAAARDPERRLLLAARARRRGGDAGGGPGRAGAARGHAARAGARGRGDAAAAAAARSTASPSCSSPTSTSAGRPSIATSSRRWWRRTNALAPDVIAITGDLVDGASRSCATRWRRWRTLRARHGVYFVTGNHEYYAGVDEWLAELPTLGIRVLRNERVAVGDGTHSFDLAGVDDFSARGVPGHGPDLPRALDGRDAGARAGAAGASAARDPRGGGARRRPAAVGAHPRRADLALELRGAAAAAVRRRAGAAQRARPSSTSAAAPATGARRCASARRAEITRIKLRAAWLARFSE